MLAEQLESGRQGAPHDALSVREYQVFCALGAGKRVTEVATEMHLSPKTVSTYRARILRKMRLDGNAALIRYAVQNDLV